jgi:hypothetical protein
MSPNLKKRISRVKTNTILHIKTDFFLNGCAFVHLRFNVFQITFQQLHSNTIIRLLYFKKHDHITKLMLFYPKVFVLVESWLHMHPHMASTIEFLIIWLKQRILVTLIKYFVCILLFKTHLQKHSFENQLALQTKKHSKNKNK